MMTSDRPINSAMTDLIEELRRAHEGDPARRAEKALWLTDLRDLMANLAAWSQPLAQAGMACVEITDHSVFEPGFGSYRASGLRLVLLDFVPHTEIQVRPEQMQIPGRNLRDGSQVLGLAGMVRVITKPDYCDVPPLLLRQAAGGWLLAEVRLGGRDGLVHPLDESVWAEALHEWLL